MLKSILKILLSNISLLFSLVSSLIIFLKIRKKKTNIFFSPEGGFGLTILKNIILLCKYKNENNFILIFGYNPNWHKRLIFNLFAQNFMWLHLTSNLFRT